MISLTGKKALITGAGRGIGREIALTLAKAGADIGVCDIDLTAAEQTAADIAALGRVSLALKADVAHADDVTATIAAFVAKFGQIDVLVNNAGITRDSLIMRMKEADWDLVLSINLKSAFLFCKEVVRPMLKTNGGKIINIASIVGVVGNAGQVNYSASKAGMIGLTKSLAREVASRGLTVNAIAPGFIQTAMTDKIPEAERSKLATAIPMQKMGQPADVANAVLFLASPLADYVTGQVLHVDGGFAI